MPDHEQIERINETLKTLCSRYESERRTNADAAREFLEGFSDLQKEIKEVVAVVNDPEIQQLRGIARLIKWLGGSTLFVVLTGVVALINNNFRLDALERVYAELKSDVKTLVPIPYKLGEVDSTMKEIKDRLIQNHEDRLRVLEKAR